MAQPILIDTDFTLDAAAALCLALTSPALGVKAIVAHSAGRPIDNVLADLASLLASLNLANPPALGRGKTPERLDHVAPCAPATPRDLQSSGLPPAAPARVVSHRDAYAKAIHDAHGGLDLLMLGPLTNLADLIDTAPDVLPGIRRVYVSGGAVWTRGDATPRAERNFHLDPDAASKVLRSGLAVTLAPLDVSRFVCLDASHAGHLASSGQRAAELCAKLLTPLIDGDAEPGPGKTIAPALVALGAILWPTLFLSTRVGLEIVLDGADRGRTKPSLARDTARRVDVLTAVNALDFLENVLESLCHETFVV